MKRVIDFKLEKAILAAQTVVALANLLISEQKEEATETLDLSVKSIGTRKNFFAIEFPLYGDRWDGLDRRSHSRCAYGSGRIDKQGKLVRTPAPHKEVTRNNIF